MENENEVKANTYKNHNDLLLPVTCISQNQINMMNIVNARECDAQKCSTVIYSGVNPVPVWSNTPLLQPTGGLVSVYCTQTTNNSLVGVTMATSASTLQLHLLHQLPA